jgi:type VI protein secretion system component Hcp
MFRLLNNLFRDFRTTKTARPARRAPRRTNLQLEYLEDRLALSTASLHAATLNAIVAPPSTQFSATRIHAAEFRITKTTDQSSPTFFKNDIPPAKTATSAEVIQHQYDKTGGNTDYLRITMTDVLISSPTSVTHS